MENLPIKYKENIFGNKDYIHYMIQYEGVYDNSIDIPGGYITLIDKNFAILSIKELKGEAYTDTRTIINSINNKVDNGDFYIVYLQPPEVYCLQEISAIEAAGVNMLEEQLGLALTGKGVVIGIIDTGIDYLNEEFMDSDGKTRINLIWDQTIDSVLDENRKVPFGQIYTSDDINKAIEAKKNGQNPYDIVPSRDENGHGTSMAGIAGASGKNPEVQGIARECEFVIVKLVQDVGFKERNGYGNEINAFSSTVIFPAIEVLKRYLLAVKKPVVILLPLGTNSGNHNGDNLIDNYIESITNNIGLAVVTGTGNEGTQDEHVSGIMQDKNSEEVIEILVEEGQKDFYLEVWVDLPNIVEVSLISPSGESTGPIQVKLNLEEQYSFVFERTKSVIYYYVPEKYTGDQLIRIYFYNITPGIWSIVLSLKLGDMAKYNAWMMQREFLSPGTRFSPSDPYGTMTIPGDSTFVVTVAAYDQNNENLLAYSGTAFRDEKADKIDFAAGGVNTLTVGLNNTTRVINGTSLSAAIGAGACVLLFQWGIVNGNYPYMYTQSIKTFLRRGTVKRRGDSYPNPHIGYGIINFYQIFENMT